MYIKIETPRGVRYTCTESEAKGLCDRESLKEAKVSGENLISTVAGEDKITMICNGKKWIIHRKTTKDEDM